MKVKLTYARDPISLAKTICVQKADAPDGEYILIFQGFPNSPWAELKKQAIEKAKLRLESTPEPEEMEI